MGTTAHPHLSLQTELTLVGRVPLEISHWAGQMSSEYESERSACGPLGAGALLGASELGSQIELMEPHPQLPPMQESQEHTFVFLCLGQQRSEPPPLSPLPFAGMEHPGIPPHGSKSSSSMSWEKLVVDAVAEDRPELCSTAEPLRKDWA